MSAALPCRINPDSMARKGNFLASLIDILKRQRLPPLGLAVLVAALILLFTHFGFYHWLIKAGLLFAVFWIRPNREFLAWYGINTLCSVANAYKNLVLRGLEPLPFFGLWPSAELFMLGTMMLPVLVFAGVQILKRKAIRTDNAQTFRGMSYLLGAALLVALLLTVKDIAYVLIDGKISEVKAGRILETVTLTWPVAFDALGSFIISHFMGAFIGILLVAPLAMWLTEPAFRAGSARMLRKAALTLVPVAVLIGVALVQSHDSHFFGLLQVMLMAAVVVFAYFQGWRGAVLSVLLVSILISVNNHMNPYSADPKLMQLYISIVGAVALLFGTAMDDLKSREADLRQRQDELFRSSLQKQELLNQLIEASRRGMQMQDAERQRIAHELHDEVGQSITALQIHLNLLQIELHRGGQGVLANRLTEISGKIGEGVRRVVLDLAPIELGELGLYMAVSHGSFARIAQQAGLQYEVVFHGDVTELDRLDIATSLAAYRIVQQALTNIVKHAHARTCRVTLRLHERRGEMLLFISVRDDGVGLAKTAPVERWFVSMRDRALALNGALHVRSRFGLRIHALLRQSAPVMKSRWDRRQPTSAFFSPI